MKYRYSHTSAFTLIELLVVIAIIGVLVGLSTRGVLAGIAMAQSASCKSNLRQMIQAAHAYAAEHNGEMPPARETNGDTGTKKTWEDILWGYDTRGRKGTDLKVCQCPSFHGDANWEEDRYTGYNYNASYVGVERFIHKGAVLNFGNPTRSAFLDRISSPETCAVFGDGQYGKGANKFMRSPNPGPLDNGAGLASAGTQGFRHRGATNVAFADGSVRSLDECFTATASRNDIATGCGFLSEDNALYSLDGQ